MLLARAPLRISFGGGATDLEAYYARYGGLVISATINKYIYSIVTKNFDANLQMISADYQSVFNMPQYGPPEQDGAFHLPRAVLDHFNLKLPINVFIASEVPPGTGLGSSGAIAVNLINVFGFLSERPVSKQEAAELAYYVEVKKLGAPVGKQDQYASAFGGLNCFRFEVDKVVVEPLALPRSTIRKLERNLMLFFTGNSRKAWDILRQQESSTAKNDGIVIESLHRIKALAEEMRQALEKEKLHRFGELLDESWRNKKKLASNISNSTIDEAYLAAKKAGAVGGKISGAGGGGFLMIYCETEDQPKVRAALAEKGFHEMRFAFEFEGARIILNTASTASSVSWEGWED